MGTKKFQIVLDNPTVYSGQTITGRVELNLDSSKKVKAISIIFKGEAHVNWSQHEKCFVNGKQQSRVVSYSGHEDYFTVKNYLLGSANSSAIELTVGKHAYPFNITLPQSAPSSYEGEKGYVRYTVKVTLDRPWKFDQIIKRAFTIISPLDLNYFPQLRNPVTLTIQKRYHCCCVKSGDILVVISVPYTGFVPGQTVPFTIQIDNTSRVGIKDIKFVLYKIVEYHSRLPTRTSNKIRTKVTKNKCGKSFPARNTSTVNATLTIPSIPPSHLTNCGIIDISYGIQAKVKFQGCHKSRVAVLPVEIGTVPLVNLESQIVEQNNFAFNSSAASDQIGIIGWDPNVSNSSTAQLLPPPTYEESQFGVKTIIDPSDVEGTLLNNDGKYFPAYPVYNFAVPTAPVLDYAGAGPSAPLITN